MRRVEVAVLIIVVMDKAVGRVGAAAELAEQ
jgi:hypothetical protein